jgi:hypothetical protein
MVNRRPPQKFKKNGKFRRGRKNGVYKKRKPVNRGNLKKANLQGLVETKTITYDTPDVTVLGPVAAADNLQQANTHVMIPRAWSRGLLQGFGKEALIGDSCFDRYLTCKTEWDFSNLSTQTANQLSNIYVLKGWCKQTMANATSAPGYQHTLFKTMVNIAAEKDNMFGTYMDFKKPWRFFKIEEKFKLDDKVKNKMKALGTYANPADNGVQDLKVPKVHHTFKWTIRRKQLLEQEHETAYHLRVNSWVPFFCVYSDSLGVLQADGSDAPICSHISKLWFSDS